MSGNEVRDSISDEVILRCQCTSLLTLIMSREDSPVIEAILPELEMSEKLQLASSGSVAITGDQFATLMEEVRRLREGQEDAALKLEKGIRRDPCIFKRRGNKNQYPF